MFQEWKSIVSRPLKIMDLLITFIPVCTTLFLIVYWPYIPEQVPQHWNEKGIIDNYSDSGSYIMLIILMFFILAWHHLSKILPTFDLKANLFGKENVHKITKQVEHQYINMLYWMLWICDFILQVTFAYIIVCGVLLRNLGIWFMPAVFAVLTLDFVFFFIAVEKFKKKHVEK